MRACTDLHNPLRCSAPRNGCYSPVDLRATGRPERLSQRKVPTAPSTNRATVYTTPHPPQKIKYNYQNTYTGVQ